MELVYKNNIIRIFYNFQKERKSLIFLYLKNPFIKKLIKVSGYVFTNNNINPTVRHGRNTKKKTT